MILHAFWILCFVVSFFLLLVLVSSFWVVRWKKRSEPYDQTCIYTTSDCQNQCGSAPGQDWEGWATTTVFGEGETCWPSGIKNALNLKCLNSVTRRTMGAAIPWRVICKTYGSRQALVDGIGSVLYGPGQDTKQQCFEVQPIAIGPDQLRQGSFDRPGNPTAPYDVNDPSIVAKDSQGSDYPTYIIYPYEGCGGDCKVGDCPDCFNSCYGSLDSEKIKQELQCDFSEIDTPCCDGMKTLWKHDWDRDNEVEFLHYSYPLAVDKEGHFDRSPKVNWCSGLSHHFDVAMNQPLWSTIIPDETHGPFSKNKGDLNNIVVRYRKITCPKPTDCPTC